MNVMTREDFRNLFIAKNDVLEYFEVRALENIIRDFYDISKREFDGISERELYMLRKRYGVFDSGICQSIGTIAREYNLSSSRVSDILNKAQHKLLHYFHNQKKLFSEIEKFWELKKLLSNTRMQLISLEELNLPISLVLDLKTLNINNLYELFNISDENLLIFVKKYKNMVSLLNSNFDGFVKGNQNISIRDMGLSTHAVNTLERAAINNLFDLLSCIKHKEDFLRIRSCGKKTIEEIIETVHSLGYIFEFEKNDKFITPATKENVSDDLDNPQITMSNTESEIIEVKVETPIEKYKRLLNEKALLQQKLLELDTELAELLFSVRESELERANNDGTTRK